MTIIQKKSNSKDSFLSATITIALGIGKTWFLITYANQGFKFLIKTDYQRIK